jgi:CheY-like chemotaxis protein
LYFFILANLGEIPMLRQNLSRQVLVVDDEPDIFTLTRLALKDLRFAGEPVELSFAASAEEAKVFLTEHPETAVILLDVVMESETAGLDLCRWIRQQQGDQRVRILMRTGQPGVAPERRVIDDYEIDGYLAKAEMTKMRLYTAVKTALKTYSELSHAYFLEQVLTFIHRVVLEMERLETPSEILQRMVETALLISHAPLVLFYLQVPELETPYLLYSGDAEQEADLNARIETVMAQLDRAKANPTGTLVPLTLPAGEGWFYIDLELHKDPLAKKVLPILAAHASHVADRIKNLHL